jgi:3-oxoacyl-[acyl-carrier protein] reductase
LVQQLLPILGDGSNIVLISSAVARTVVEIPVWKILQVLLMPLAMLGPSGMRVNAVAPGVIDTDMSNFTKTEAGREVTSGMQALKRIGKPEDVADVVAFVVSDAPQEPGRILISVESTTKTAKGVCLCLPRDCR